MNKSSVIITCHNYGAYLSWCILSVLHQTRQAREIIVVNDASDDCTDQVAGQFESAIRYYKVAFRNAQKARNFGLSHATGEYVLFLDADDFLDNTALELMETELEKDSELKLVYSDRFNFGDPQLIKSLEYSYYSESRDFNIETLKLFNFISLPSLLRRKHFRGFDERIDRFQDWEAWLNLLLPTSKARRIPRPLFHQRFHGENKTFIKNEYTERLKILTKHGLLRLNSDYEKHENTSVSVTPLKNLLVVFHSPERLDQDVFDQFMSVNKSNVSAFYLIGKQSKFEKLGILSKLKSAEISHAVLDGKTVDTVLRIIEARRPFLEKIEFLLMSDFSVAFAGLIDEIKNTKQDACGVFSENEVMSISEFEHTNVVALNRNGLRRLLYLPNGGQMESTWVQNAREFLNRNIFWRFSKHDLNMWS